MRDTAELMRYAETNPATLTMVKALVKAKGLISRKEVVCGGFND